MTRPISKNQMADLWMDEFMENHHCCLCGNHGVIDTVGKVHTPAGVECGAKVWCICPNGRVMKSKSGLKRPL